MQSPPNPVDLAVPIALIGAVSALLGALFGAAVTLMVDSRNRKEKRRDEIRAAYVEWFTALDVLTFRETQDLSVYIEMKKVLFEQHLPQAARDAAASNLMRIQQSQETEKMDAVHRESSAFARLMIADGRNAELTEVNRIRQISPFKTCNTVEAATGNYVPDAELFYRLEKEQAIALGALAQRIHRRFA